MGDATGSGFFERAYSLGDMREESGFGWPAKGVGEEMTAFLESIKKSLRTGNFLDIGCGEGRISIFFAKNGFESYGIDFIPQAVRRAKKHSYEAGVHGRCHFIAGNALYLPYRSMLFDAAVDWSVFDHIEPGNWPLYIDNILRALKPGGHYMLSAFSINTPWMKGRKNEYYSGDAYFHFFTENEIRNLFGKHFNIIEIREKVHPKPEPVFVFYHALMQKRDR